MRFGAFGKMPAAGDFLRLNTPVGFVQIWDAWLQSAMLTAQRALGQDWDAHYMSAPIWRFSLAAGLAGPQPVMGVMMPSVDRVGRRFPLTLMASLPPSPGAELGHFTRADLFEAAETLALDTLEDDMSRDVLARRLAMMTTPDEVILPAARPVGSALLLDAPECPGVLPGLAASLLAGTFRHPSLWSTIVENREHAMICEGLPDAPRMQTLFAPTRIATDAGDAA